MTNTVGSQLDVWRCPAEPPLPFTVATKIVTEPNMNISTASGHMQTTGGQGAVAPTLYRTDFSSNIHCVSYLLPHWHQDSKWCSTNMWGSRIVAGRSGICFPGGEAGAAPCAGVSLLARSRRQWSMSLWRASIQDVWHIIPLKNSREWRDG